MNKYKHFLFTKFINFVKFGLKIRVLSVEMSKNCG